MSMRVDYTVPTRKSYADAVQAVVDATQAHGFKVQFTHDVAETLAERGFSREPVTLVEVCQAKHAAKVLEADVNIGLMLPCPIMVYEKAGEVLIATMRPTLIGAFFPEAGIDGVAAEVEKVLFEVVDEAAA